MLSTFVLQGLAFLSGPIFSNALGANNYGIAAVYLAWVQIASTVFSLQAAGMISIARITYPIEDQEKYQSSVMSLSSVFFLVFSIITLVVAAILKKWFDINIAMLCFGLVHAWGLYCVKAMNEKFTYEFNAIKNFALSTITSGLAIGISLFFVHLYPADINYWGRIIGQSLVYAFIGLLLFIYILNKGRTVYSKEYWGFTIPLAIPTVFHLLAHIVLNQCDKIMLKAMINYSAVSIYALACTFGAVLQTLWHAFNNSWVPFYYEYTRENQNEAVKRHAKNYIELFTIITIGFIMLSREIFHIYVKDSFWYGTDLIPLFSIGYYFIFLYSFPVNYEFYNKKTKTVAAGTTIAAVCNVLLNYIFINFWGILGAVIATVVAHGLQFGFHFINATIIKPKEFPFKIIDFMPGLIGVCVACFLYMFTREMWLIRWGIGVLLGIYLIIKVIKRKEIF